MPRRPKRRLLLKPVKGLLVRDCRTFRALKPGGQWKVWTAEWQKAINSGDVIVVNDETGELGPKPKKAKPKKTEE